MGALKTIDLENDPGDDWVAPEEWTTFGSFLSSEVWP